MTTVIYADTLFIINACIDYLCFYCVYKFFNLKIKLKRMLLASLLGGVYGIFAVLLFSGIIHFLILSLMCYIAFGIKDKKVLKKSIVFIVISSLMGGLATAIYNILDRSGSSAICIVIASAITIVYIMSEKRRRSKCEVMLSLCINDKIIEEKAFVDSGNLLTDPYSGKSVILVKRGVLGDNFIADEQNGFRIIPVNYKEEKIIRCFVPDNIIAKIDNFEHELDAVVAIDETSGDFGGCNILLPEVLIGELK